MRSILALGILTATLPPIALCQAVIQADNAIIQPQVYRNGPTIDGCGQRILLSSVVSERELYIADFSLSVRLNVEKQSIWSMTKAGLYRQNPAQAVSSGKTVPISSFFISSPDGLVAVAPEQIIPTKETPGFLLGIGRDDASAATQLMLNMLQGERTQFGVRLKSEGVARVYSFQAQISAGDAADFRACMEGFMALIEKVKADLESDVRPK